MSKEITALCNGAGLSSDACVRFWPVRKYPWGSCEALSSLHSDLSALKKLLFEVMYEELKQLTEQRYYKFRQNTLFNLDDPNR